MEDKMTKLKNKKRKNKKCNLAFTSNGDGTCYVSGIGTCTETDIIIPSKYRGESVTGIGELAFYKRSDMKTVIIPEGVTDIGELAFYNCTGLTSITFNGTKAQWNAISKGSSWKGYVPATEVVCSDGSVSLG